jgi:hypothetical protein
MECFERLVRGGLLLLQAGAVDLTRSSLVRQIAHADSASRVCQDLLRWNGMVGSQRLHRSFLQPQADAMNGAGPREAQLLELACERTCECAAGFADKEYW